MNRRAILRKAIDGLLYRTEVDISYSGYDGKLTTLGDVDYIIDHVLSAKRDDILGYMWRDITPLDIIRAYRGESFPKFEDVMTALDCLYSIPFTPYYWWVSGQFAYNCPFGYLAVIRFLTDVLDEYEGNGGTTNLYDGDGLFARIVSYDYEPCALVMSAMLGNNDARAAIMAYCQEN